MQTDLSPICKSLIALLASGASFTRGEIYSALPDADRATVDQTLDMLVRATVVIEGDLIGADGARGRVPCYYLGGADGRGSHQTPAKLELASTGEPSSHDESLAIRTVFRGGKVYLAGIGALPETVDNGSRADAHTGEDPSGVACVQITRHRNYNVGSAIRHLWCVGLRDGSSRAAREQIKAIKEARFYLDDEIERLQLTLAQGGAA
ncbi:hypothetical protein [Paraburkholderia tropica]|uniref:hypothetical protein n=1 Tax=Paraburkholderia tropica TaxID=92647 RepID=UPI0017C99DBE|nr:hypothetical protein [Paraburkholderia tropica]MBB6319273.1 hypothetical protein [Paraburkholderia tropica]